ncbi:hypothetical protein AM493_19210 [Flavobacterium akiainvivens]|uniref:Uncharacterized protein n=1 Tax=Flavobacterium akiainvivens TaxID=1202724 RepID=A0A0M9VJN9_9FLAO|nr:hypothetical protein [Flavobacterium akiainvivens]KOS07946.1 hypothetical protein AM493_19210 [Flavobacterium akiainvivens]SFQ29439.1 hypothetical protein SAMN05444144_102424 [Flavobacterium akiainvivens]
MDYTALENDFECACQDVITTLKSSYKTSYSAGGAAKLEAFLNLIKTEFDTAEAKFIDTNKLTGNTEALKRVRDIAKKHAKTCLEYYARVQ